MFARIGRAGTCCAAARRWIRAAVSRGFARDDPTGLCMTPPTGYRAQEGARVPLACRNGHLSPWVPDLRTVGGWPLAPRPPYRSPGAPRPRQRPSGTILLTRTPRADRRCAVPLLFAA